MFHPDEFSSESMPEMEPLMSALQNPYRRWQTPSSSSSTSTSPSAAAAPPPSPQLLPLLPSSLLTFLLLRSATSFHPSCFPSCNISTSVFLALLDGRFVAVKSFYNPTSDSNNNELSILSSIPSSSFIISLRGYSSHRSHYFMTNDTLQEALFVVRHLEKERGKGVRISSMSCRGCEVVSDENREEEKVDVAAVVGEMIQIWVVRVHR